MQPKATFDKDVAYTSLEKRVRAAADQSRANSGLNAQEYSGPILGFIFLHFAEMRFAAQSTKLETPGASSRLGSRVDGPAVSPAENVLHLAPEPRLDPPLNLPEAADIRGKLNAAMREVGKNNPNLAGVLPKTLNLFTDTLLKELLTRFRGLLVLNWRQKSAASYSLHLAIEDALNISRPANDRPVYNKGFLRAAGTCLRTPPGK